MDVPRPSSSNATIESLVAPRRIADASAHSTKNVDSPAWILSPAPPSLANTASAGVRTHDLAGTGAPICAKTTATHVALRSVDLPPMFGPVRSIAGGVDGSAFSPPSATSLGTTPSAPAAGPAPLVAIAVTMAHGCQRSFASNTGSPFGVCPRVTKTGRHMGCDAPPSLANAARDDTASTSAHAAAAATHEPECSRNRSRSAVQTSSASRIARDASSSSPPGSLDDASDAPNAAFVGFLTDAFESSLEREE